MERYQKVAKHKKLHMFMDRIRECEQGRQFCGHDWEHLLAVARIAYIIALENHMDLSKDLIYGAALLHDIGKEAQYKRGVPHEIEGALLAQGILEDCGYDEAEIHEISQAILGHRRYKEDNNDFQKLLYRADKLSRPCRSCPVADECNWPEEQKNTGVYL